MVQLSTDSHPSKIQSRPMSDLSVSESRRLVGWPPSLTADGPAGVTNIDALSIVGSVASRLRE